MRTAYEEQQVKINKLISTKSSTTPQEHPYLNLQPRVLKAHKFKLHEVVEKVLVVATDEENLQVAFVKNTSLAPLKHDFIHAISNIKKNLINFLKRLLLSNKLSLDKPLKPNSYSNSWKDVFSMPHDEKVTL